jgi:phage portal protein, HK97 family
MRFGPFKFFERKALTAEQIIEMLGGGASTSSGIAVSADTALRVPAVAAAVRTIAEACASLECRVVQIDDDGSETVDRSHPANVLLSGEANEWTSSFELIRSLVVDALTRDQGGLAWVNWIRGEPVEIIRYRPGIIAAEFDKDGSGRPVYRINGNTTPADQIIHVRSTFDKCPVTLCREAIGAALVMERHASQLFGKGARPGGVIETDKHVGDEGVRKMLAGWRASQEGAENAGKTAVLWDGAHWKQMTLSSVDAQFQQLRVFQLQEIARAFNIPSVLIGELSRATWSNSAEMQRLFLMLCLEPWLLALEGAFRRALIAKDDRKRFAIRFERDDFSKVDLAVLATAMNSLIASRVLNPNEARSWLDMAPYDGGNEFANPNTGASQPGSSTAGGASDHSPNLGNENEDEENNDA